MTQRNFEGSKGKPKVESLYNNPIHKEVMRRIRVNYGDKFTSIHMVYNDITFPSGAG
jgi:hypothetical protein